MTPRGVAANFGKHENSSDWGFEISGIAETKVLAIAEDEGLSVWKQRGFKPSEMPMISGIWKLREFKGLEITKI